MALINLPNNTVETPSQWDDAIKTLEGQSQAAQNYFNTKWASELPSVATDSDGRYTSETVNIIGDQMKLTINYIYKNISRDNWWLIDHKEFVITQIS